MSVTIYSKPADAKIFISIACYRDPELLPTLRSLIESAEYPARLHIAVCWQEHGEPDVFQAAGLPLAPAGQVGDFPVWHGRCDGALVDVIAVAPERSEGACWARALCESRYAGEDYFLQLDAHARFADRWDRELIAMLEGLRGTSPKPLLSAYVASYRAGPPEVRDPTAYRLVFDKFTPDGIPLFLAHAFSAGRPAPGTFISGHFLFADGTFVREVPNDPQIYFTGEEIAMALRAFARGYDAYAPHRTLVWHQYGREGRGLHWDDHPGDAAQEAWWARDRRSRTYVRHLLVPDGPGAGGISGDGSPAERTLAEFEHACGLSFSTLKVHPRVLSAERCGFFPPEPQANACHDSRAETGAE